MMPKTCTWFLPASFILSCVGIEVDVKTAQHFQDERKHLWTKYDNELLRKIDNSQREYNASQPNAHKILNLVMDEDLKTFRGGITSKMLQSAANFGTTYQLINGTLYRDKSCLFPNRCEGVEHFLTKLTNLSNFEIVVNLRDYPQVSKFSNANVPVFSFSKTGEYADITYPAWSFWCGGPAIKLYPTGIGRWDRIRKILMDEASKWPWEKKKSMAFFRGSRTSVERDELIYLSRESPELIDAAYTKNQAWKSKKDTLDAEPATEVSFEDHCRYKYLFNFRGVAASFRFKHLFLCKSLVFHVGDEWTEFFYPLLKPWVHYVPVNSNYSREDVRKLLEFFKRHESISKRISENGFNLVKEHLKIGKITWYWKTLLSKYIKLQKFEPVLNRQFIRVS